MHHPFTDIVREASKKNWGWEAKSHEEALKNLTKNGYDLTSAAILEIVRRINQAIEALASDKTVYDPQYDRNDGRSLWYQRVEKPSNAASFPGIKIGDMLYSCEDPQDGVNIDIVIHVDQETSHVRTVPKDPRGDAVCVGWALDGDCFRTPQEALAQAAKHDLEYHAPKVRWSQEILKAIENDEDVSRFMDGMPDEE